MQFPKALMAHIVDRMVSMVARSPSTFMAFSQRGLDQSTLSSAILALLASEFTLSENDPP